MSNVDKFADNVKDTVKETAKNVEKDVKDNADAQALREQLSVLQEDFAKLSATVAATGRETGHAAAKSVKDGASKLYEIGESAALDVAVKAEDAYTEANALIRRQPAASIGLAAGLGLVVGLLIARK